MKEEKMEKKKTNEKAAGLQDLQAGELAQLGGNGSIEAVIIQSTR